MNTKNEFRKRALTIRDGLDNDLVSSKIINNIFSWDIFQNAKNVMIFYPIKSEVNLLSLLTVDDKNYYFPKIIGDDIVPVYYKKELGFVQGRFKIQEPLGEILEDFSKLDLIFVPALAVNPLGFRLGYGRGYYDRFLNSFDKSNIATCVPVSKSLIFNDLPTETHDEKIGFIMTEVGVLTSNNLDDPNPLHHKLNI